MIIRITKWNSAHELLINKLGGFFALDNYLNVIQQLIHAGLVFVGQYVVDKVWREKVMIDGHNLHTWI